MTAIYGLRAIGDTEIRYVGRSDGELSARLLKHRQNVRRAYPPKVSAWIASEADIEIVPLATCERDEAARLERETVQRLHREGHRLTNGHLLPREPAVAA